MSVQALATRTVPTATRSVVAGKKTSLARRLPMVLVCVGIAGLPVLTPAGPGNTGPADLFTLSAVIAVLWVAVRYRERVRAHYAPAILVYFLAGGLAAVLSPSPGGGLIALMQDLFMLGWAIAVAHVARTESGLSTVAAAWSYVAVGWALALDIGVLVHLSALAGYTADEGSRAALTFGDPNRAGAYFFISFFVLMASRRPRHWLLRIIAEILVLLGVVYTGSNSAVVGVLLGVAIVLVISCVHRFGARPVMTAIAVLVIATGYVSTKVDPRALQRRAVNEGQLLANTLGRSGKGGEDRGLLLKENLRLYRAGSVLGAGPGRTKATLAKEQAQYVKEAHNDYMATLVERGIGGLVGIFLLACALASRARVLCRRAARSAALPRPHVLVGAVVAVAVSGMFHEVLHWRHVWALLAVYAAAATVARHKQRGMA